MPQVFIAVSALSGLIAFIVLFPLTELIAFMVFMGLVKSFGYPQLQPSTLPTQLPQTIIVIMLVWASSIRIIRNHPQR